MKRQLKISGLIVLCTLIGPPASVAQVQRPVALVATPKSVYVACRDSGAVVAIDPATLGLQRSRSLAESLSDLAVVPGFPLLVATDQHAGEVLLVDPQQLTVLDRTSVTSPVEVSVAPDGSRCFVSSLWARRLTIVRVDAPGRTLGQRTHIDLPFAPRKQWLSEDATLLIVADSFGGRLAAIDPSRMRLLGVAEIPGHNIRGLAADPETGELLLSHQWLQPHVPTTRDHVFWGNVLTNVLRSIDVSRIAWDAAESAGAPVYGSIIPLGGERRGAGDPTEIVVTSTGQTVTLLGGVGRVAVRTSASQPVRHVEVGQRPIDAAVDSSGRIWVANMFDDSVSILSPDAATVTDMVSLPPEFAALTPAQRGERDFYDATLSLDGWFSCHSCHTDGHTCGRRNDNFGDNTIGAPRQIPSLLGTAETQPWGWNGATPSLGPQIDKSLDMTMRRPPDDQTHADVTGDLLAFLGTLQPPPGVDVARGTVDPLQAAEGRRLFESIGCVNCHTPPLYTSPDTFDVGMTDEQGRSFFNPPSLRGVSQRGPYFHDNRARTLRDVVYSIRHQIPAGTTDAERAALLAFLRTL